MIWGLNGLFYEDDWVLAYLHYVNTPQNACIGVYFGMNIILCAIMLEKHYL